MRTGYYHTSIRLKYCCAFDKKREQIRLSGSINYVYIGSADWHTDARTHDGSLIVRYRKPYSGMCRLCEVKQIRSNLRTVKLTETSVTLQENKINALKIFFYCLNKNHISKYILSEYSYIKSCS